MRVAVRGGEGGSVIPARLEGGPHDGYTALMPLEPAPRKIAVRPCTTACGCGRDLHLLTIWPDPLPPECAVYLLKSLDTRGLLYRYADMNDPTDGRRERVPATLVLA